MNFSPSGSVSRGLRALGVFLLIPAMKALAWTMAQTGQFSTAISDSHYAREWQVRDATQVFPLGRDTIIICLTVMWLLQWRIQHWAHFGNMPKSSLLTKPWWLLKCYSRDIAKVTLTREIHVFLLKCGMVHFQHLPLITFLLRRLMIGSHRYIFNNSMYQLINDQPLFTFYFIRV